MPSKPLRHHYINSRGIDYPEGTPRNNDVITTPKRRRFNVIMTLLLRHVSVGYEYRITGALSSLRGDFNYLRYQFI